MREHNVNSLDNFIAGWYLDDLSICDEMIEYHKTSKDKFAGVAGDGVNPEIKDSVDCYIELPTLHKVINSTTPIVKQYIKKYPRCATNPNWGVTTKPQIQYYKPGSAYFDWHCERSGNKQGIVSRHLAFLIYLNDVNDGGETEWFHQKVKIKPEKGLTLIWPVDWTFTHRGLPSPTEEKYIVTGWFNYF